MDPISFEQTKTIEGGNMSWRASLEAVKSRVEAVGDFVEKLSRLSSDIWAFFTAVQEWVGWATLLLLLFVLLLAPLWGLLGVPKGRLQFLVSLVTANLLLLWFGLRLGFWSDIQWGLFRGDLILLIPFVLIWLAPYVWRRAQRLGLRWGRGASLTPKKTAQAWDELRRSFVHLDESLYHELLASQAREGEGYRPSPDVLRAWRQWRKRQQEFEDDFFGAAGQD